jgi:putative salt-induced outer membrane protein YdiY
MNWNLPIMTALLIPAFSAVTRTGAEAAEIPLRMVVTTNYVIVTNIILVTNYVRETATATVTNGSGALTSTLPRPPAPMSDNADWVQLKSGEWLRGKITSFTYPKLNFDSDKLKDQTFDFKDLVQLWSPRAFCLYGQDNSATGKVHLDGPTITVIGTNEVTFPRDDLVTLSPGTLTEKDYWSGKFSVGANLRSGNTEGADLTSSFTIERRTLSTDIKLEEVGNYSELSGVENVNNFRADLTYDILLTPRVFIRPLFGEYYRDKFQNIRHRGTVSVGAGYFLIKHPDMQWTINGGPGYQYTVFEATEPGSPETASTPAGVLATDFERDLTSKISLEIHYQAIITGTDSGLVTHHSATILSIDITRRLDLDAAFIWDRTERPEPSADGSIPKKDDLRFTLSVGVKF